MNGFILVITAICGLPFLSIGLYEIYQADLEISRLVSARGTVVGDTYAAVPGDGGSISGVYLPVVEFTLPSGKKIRFTDRVGSLPADYEVGASVEILYAPGDVHQVRINSWKRIWLAPILLTAVGLLPLLIGGILCASQAKILERLLLRLGHGNAVSIQ